MTNINSDLYANSYKFASEIDRIMESEYNFILAKEDFNAMVEVLSFPASIEKQLALRENLLDITPKVLLHRIRYIESLVKLYHILQKRSHS